PQGPEADPVTTAVLASSLSVEAAVGASGASGTLALLDGRLSSTHAAANPYIGAGAVAGAAGPTAQGISTKHQFFGVYSRPSITGGGGNAAAAAGAAAAAARGEGAPSTSAGAAARASSARSTARAGGVPSLSLNHPLVMHPTVASGATARAGPTANIAASGSGAAAQAPRARFATTDMYAPVKLVRPQELDELDHRAMNAAAAAAMATSGGGGSGAAHTHVKPWMTGPFRHAVGTGGAPGAGGAARGHGRPEDDAELRALREKWSAMDARTSQSVADVQNKVAEWTLQRARLEEEIVRRQEVNRFAPAGSGAGGMPGYHSQWHGDNIPPGTLSPYANANADLAAATAAAATHIAMPAGAPGAVSFMLPGSNASGGTAAAAAGASMRLRHAEVGSYDMGRADLVTRLASLGVAVSGETLDRALRPVEDRPFLECISKLPKPGEHLVSRPGSERLPAAKKKQRSKSAGKKRPTSGR
ncbi:hypothetical protein TSOC_014473, partial [Tetrabaena socialis]